MVYILALHGQDTPYLAHRAAPGHARLHRAAGAALGAVSRLWHRPAHSVAIPRRAPGRDRIALSRAATARAPRRDRDRVGYVEQQSTRAHVSPHGEGPRASHRRAVAMGAAVRGDRLAHAAAGSGGVMSILEWLPWVRERRTNELADELRAHLEMAEA